MKHYNIQNYIRYKEELTEKLFEECCNSETSREDLILCARPLVEAVAWKFVLTYQASGVMSILDLIQEGTIGLINAVDRIDWDKVYGTAKPGEEPLMVKGFLRKRIKGSIRRAIDINRGSMRIPEHRLNEIRKNSSNKEMVKVFFDSIFVSLDVNTSTDANILLQIPDSSTTYNINILNQYLMGLMRMHLTDLEYNVLRMSYGLDCDKLSAKEISEKLDIKGSASYVRVSQIKKDGIDKLIKNVEPEQVVDYLG